MYKVFIDNSPLIFTKKKENTGKYGFIINDELNPKLFDLIFYCLSINKEKLPILIICKKPKTLFNSFFENYDKITAAGGIVQKGKEFLFIKRNGFWDIPKGKIEKNESIKKGATREIEEECGIHELILMDQICETYHTYQYNGIDTIKKTYWFHYKYKGNEELKPQIEEGITDVKWFRKKDFKVIKENTFASIVEVLDNFNI